MLYLRRDPFEPDFWPGKKALPQLRNPLTTKYMGDSYQPLIDALRHPKVGRAHELYTPQNLIDDLNRPKKRMTKRLRDLDPDTEFDLDGYDSDDSSVGPPAGAGGAGGGGGGAPLPAAPAGPVTRARSLTAGGPGGGAGGGGGGPGGVGGGGGGGPGVGGAPPGVPPAPGAGGPPPGVPPAGGGAPPPGATGASDLKPTDKAAIAADALENSKFRLTPAGAPFLKPDVKGEFKMIVVPSTAIPLSYEDYKDKYGANMFEFIYKQVNEYERQMNSGKLDGTQAGAGRRRLLAEAYIESIAARAAASPAGAGV